MKKIFLKNCLLLNTISMCLLYGIDAKAELWVTSTSGKDTEAPLYKSYPDGESRWLESKFYLAETRLENTFTAQQTFGDLTFSTEGSAIVNTIAKSISSSSTDNELITAKGVYDYLDDAGISDMSIYAKTADVYTQTQADNKFATQESLGSYVTSSIP